MLSNVLTIYGTRGYYISYGIVWISCTGVCCIIGINLWQPQCFWTENTVSFSVLQRGSMLSPYIFNIFIDELMENLESCPYGIRIGSLSLNTAGYADDITLIASTVTDLQQLVNICYHYSCKWRFAFWPSKSKCIKMYKRISAPMESPDIWLGSNKLEFVSNVEIFGRVSVITCHRRTTLIFAFVIAGVQCIVSVSTTKRLVLLLKPICGEVSARPLLCMLWELVTSALSTLNAWNHSREP